MTLRWLAAGAPVRAEKFVRFVVRVTRNRRAMPLAVPFFAIAFNALLWLTRISLSPIVRMRLGSAAAWGIALVAPIALLALAMRLGHRRREAFVFVAIVSLAAAGFVTGT